MLKLIREYLKTGIETHRSVSIAQETLCKSFNLQAESLQLNLIVQKTDEFREKERVFDKIKTLNSKKKKTELEEKELLNLISYIDTLI